LGCPVSLLSLPINIPNISADPADEGLEWPVGLLDDWMPRLIETNEILTAALIRVTGFCISEASTVVADRVQAEVDVALERAGIFQLDP
jgi:hypothetical protein